MTHKLVLIPKTSGLKRQEKDTICAKEQIILKKRKTTAITKNGYRFSRMKAIDLQARRRGVRVCLRSSR